jgi:TolB protein
MFLRTLLVTAVASISSLAGQVGAVPATAGPEAEPVPTPADGWYLASVDHGPRGDHGIEPTRQRLELVSPAGERTRVWGKRLGPHQRGAFQLVDWSADGRTALVVVDGGLARQRAVRVDVSTGATTRIALDDSVSSVLLDGDGGLLAVGYPPGGHRGAPLWRVGADGERTRLAGRVDGPVLPSADGAVLVTGTAGSSGRAVRVLDRDGRVQRRVETPAHCTPVRWWDASSALVQCWRHRGPTLSLVDVATGEVTALTRPHGKDSIDLGDLDARRTESGLYLQASGPCGYVFLARQRRHGAVEQVRVPHSVGNVLLVDSDGEDLVIQHAISCDGAAPRSALGRFDPVTREEQVLAALGGHEAFGRVLPFGEQQASLW